MYMSSLGELFRTLRAEQVTQDELDAHGDVINVLNYFDRIWTGPSKYLIDQKMTTLLENFNKFKLNK